MLLLLACTQAALQLGDTGRPRDTGGGDTPDTGDTADSGDTADTGELQWDCESLPEVEVNELDGPRG